MKASADLLQTLKGISGQLNDLASRPAEYELDPDAVVDLNLARSSVEKLIHRLERLLE
jgi:hypothetical protein